MGFGVVCATSGHKRTREAQVEGSEGTCGPKWRMARRGASASFAAQTVREVEWDSEQTHLPKLLDALFLVYTECRVV